MKPEKFEQAVLTGKITDFEPYLREMDNIKEDMLVPTVTSVIT